MNIAPYLAYASTLGLSPLVPPANHEVFLRAEELVANFLGFGLDIRKARHLMRTKLPAIRLHHNGARVVRVDDACALIPSLASEM